MVTPKMHQIRRPQAAGVSLVEALVALAVMSFGMLALVGVQTTMRYNSDVARQRTEATRIAASDMESMRLFTNLDAVPGQTTPSWDQLADGSITDISLPGASASTRFQLTRNLELLHGREGNDARVTAAQSRLVSLQVQWTDRTNANNLASFNSVVAGVAPGLSARLALPFVPGPVSQREGRHPSIPLEARDLGNGNSAYKPFDQGSNAWVMNNTTGWITQICTATLSQTALTTSALSACAVYSVPGRLVSGKVQFDRRNLTEGVVDAAGAESPRGPVLPLDTATPLYFLNEAGNAPVNQARDPICVSQQVSDESAALALASTRPYISYACVVFPSDPSGWGGQLRLKEGNYGNGDAGNWQIGVANEEYRVCRYSTSTSAFTANTDHPRTYCRVSNDTCTSRVTDNLINQNFLVLRSTQSCPTDSAIDLAAGNLVNSNTLPHQP